ncbi:MAG TPA: hypothetical protein VGZ93_10950 [Candidatus Methylacidiphilales bacterium]|jgi:hypothetical protein|nr:hypothetical protein [Candidatus Methylacidiphilales bacterium]
MTAFPHVARLGYIVRRTGLFAAVALALLAPLRGEDQDKALLTTNGPPLLPPTALSSDDYNRINASARGLAGEKASGDTGAAPWESAKEWKDYAEKLDGNWNYLNRVRLDAMRIWGNTELGGLRGRTGTVFYPFSGPDVLYADTLFPNSRVLLMAGLEPVGTMPDLAKLEQDGKLGPYLAQVKTSLFTILAASFFKTKDMKTDFNNQLVDGLMPAMIVFLAREGYSINGIQYVVLDHDGVLHPHGEVSGAPGVQITYDNGRTLLYFQADLGNDGLKDNPGFVRLMHRLAPGITYLKAASYLLYDDYFSTIRDAILDNSAGVVEDDSGIPFKDFNPAQWDVAPYGNYTGPIGLFKDKLQPDLTAFYAKTPHQPLTFGSGYKFVAAQSSLLVAKKKQ